MQPIHSVMCTLSGLGTSASHLVPKQHLYGDTTRIEAVARVSFLIFHWMKMINYGILKCLQPKSYIESFMISTDQV